MLHLKAVQAGGQRGTQLLERADHAVGTANVLNLRVARAVEESERLLECKAAGGAGHERVRLHLGAQVVLLHTS